MANYYELLKVSPSASAQEISSAFDTQYEQWRRLVTHHDPNVVNQANQALQLLEQIRATLSDPAKRAAYDEGIGLRSVGGLADPTAILNMPSVTMTPPAPRPMPGAAQPASVLPTQPALWTCPKCAKENPPNTRFCFSCGTQLVRACPECGQETSLVATGFCGNCGYNYDVAAQRANLKSEISSASSRVSHASSQLNEAKGRTSKAMTWTVIGIIGLVIACFMTASAAQGYNGASSAIGTALFCILPTALVTIGAFVSVQGFSSKKKTDIENAQASLNAAAAERNHLQQQFDQLALRKTEKA
ncbi:zinc-ribbon domain-containing protein [Anaerolineae bacterium CFX7]|nr:zinc-ribbon domain-containing protein [Anaerolineae bacterium CFX7]